jgi:dUTP pyrophosphatase
MHATDPVIFKVKKLSSTANIPVRKHPDDAGIDIFSDEDVELRPSETQAVSTGISVEFRPGYVALIYDRSSMGARGIHHFAGVIDAGYRGEWKIVLHNASGESYRIQRGDRIAQCILQPIVRVSINESDKLQESPRGTDGFGSTGR